MSRILSFSWWMFFFLLASVVIWITIYYGGSLDWLGASASVYGRWVGYQFATMIGEITGKPPLGAGASLNATVAAASTYVTWLGWGVWNVPTAPWYIWLGSLGTVSPIWWLYFRRHNPTAKITDEKWVRGMKLVTEKKLRRALKRAGGDGLVIGDGMRLSRAKEREGVLAVGATGSGKTAGVINRIVADVTARPKTKTVIYDVKGDFTEGVESFYLFAPWDERCFGFSLANEIRDEGDCDLIALACVPPLPQASNPFWQDAPRMICAAILWGLKVEGRLSWAALDEALSDRDELLRILMLTMKGKKCQDYFADEESAGNVMACLQKELSFVTYMVNAGMDDNKVLSVRDWYHADDGKVTTLILQRNAKFDRMSAKLITVIIQLLILESQSLDNDSTRRRFFILDELGTLPQIANLVSDGINLLRQKGVCFVIGIQDIAGLRRVYGPEQAQEISNSLATKVIYRMSEANTVRWAEETLGKAEYLVDARSVSDQRDKSQKSESKNQRREVRPVVMASEIAAIPESRIGKCINYWAGVYYLGHRPIVGYLLVGGLDGLVARCEWKYFGFEKIRAAIEWADWVSHLPAALPTATRDSGGEGQGESMMPRRNRKLT